LVLNTIQGTDKGVASAKALGSEKRVSLWKTENQSGVIVPNVPAALQNPEVQKRLFEPIEE